MRRPERRNRKIGTASAGYKKRGSMHIPESWLDRHGEVTPFWSRLDLARIETHRIGDATLKILYETPHAGFGYGCSPRDVVFLLGHVAPDGWGLPDLILFRQPTRKQAQQNPVWGRFLYLAEIGEVSGTAIVLEAQQFGGTLHWPRKLSVADQGELARLKADGHVFQEGRRGFTATLSEATIRNTILYRTVLHELGHFRQYQAQTEDPGSRLSKDASVASDLHDAVPASELEAFAHRFAEAQAKALEARGAIPFEPLEPCA